jgi:hypothetical protein
VPGNMYSVKSQRCDGSSFNWLVGKIFNRYIRFVKPDMFGQDGREYLFEYLFDNESNANAIFETCSFAAFVGYVHPFQCLSCNSPLTPCADVQLYRLAYAQCACSIFRKRLSFSLNMEIELFSHVRWLKNNETQIHQRDVQDDAERGFQEL